MLCFNIGTYYDCNMEIIMLAHQNISALITYRAVTIMSEQDDEHFDNASEEQATEEQATEEQVTEEQATEEQATEEQDTEDIKIPPGAGTLVIHIYCKSWNIRVLVYITIF